MSQESQTQSLPDTKTDEDKSMPVSKDEPRPLGFGTTPEPSVRKRAWGE